jgi:hypothetical protein
MLRALVAGLPLAALLLVACNKPVHCNDYALKGGERPSLTTFPKAVNTRTWSQCSDGKTRDVTCTPGHLSAWKCTCSVDKHPEIETRRDADLPDDRDGATSVANQACHWKLQ